MIPERLISIAAELPIAEVGMLSGLNDESKVAFSMFSASINLVFLYVFSRTNDGSVNSNWEKGIIGVAGTVFTIGNALINHQVWT